VPFLWKESRLLAEAESAWKLRRLDLILGHSVSRLSPVTAATFTPRVAHTKLMGGALGHTHMVSVSVNHRAVLPSCKRMSLQKNVAWHECAQNGKWKRRENGRERERERERESSDGDSRVCGSRFKYNETAGSTGGFA